jgi:hypothetical protein
MSDQSQATQPQAQPQTSRPEIKGKVLAVLDEWRNNTGTFWKREVIVETGFRFPNPLKVTFQKEATSHLEGVAEGDGVTIPYVLNGREYDGRYYVDIVGLGLQKFYARQGGATQKQGSAAQAAPAPAPVQGCTAAIAIETWAKYHGDDKAGFAEFCKARKPGMPSKSYGVADWADIVNAIEAAQNAAPAPATAPEDDDLPF